MCNSQHYQIQAGQILWCIYSFRMLLDHFQACTVLLTCIGRQMLAIQSSSGLSLSIYAIITCVQGHRWETQLSLAQLPLFSYTQRRRQPAPQQPPSPS